MTSQTLNPLPHADRLNITVNLTFFRNCANYTYCATLMTIIPTGVEPIYFPLYLEMRFRACCRQTHRLVQQLECLMHAWVQYCISAPLT